MASHSGDSLVVIIAETEKVLSIITHVVAASEEQASASGEISKNIDGISNVTQETAAGTQEIARAAEDLNRLTINLRKLVDRFKIEEEAHSSARPGERVEVSGVAERQLLIG